MTEIVTKLVVDAAGAYRMLDDFGKSMEDAGEAAFNTTAAIDRYNAASQKLADAQAKGLRVSTMVLGGISAEMRQYEQLKASLGGVTAMQIRFHREQERAALRAINAVRAGYETEEGALRTLMALQEKHDAILRKQALATTEAAAANDNNAQAAARLAMRTEELRLAFDRGYAASTQMDKALADLAEAERLGITITDGYAAALDKLAMQYDSSAQAAERLARRTEELRLTFDRGYAAATQVDKALADLAEAERLGITITGGYAAALDKLAMQYDSSAQAAERLARRTEELRLTFDRGYAASTQMDKALADLAEAERLGITITGGYAAALDNVILKYDETARAAKMAADQQAEMIRQARAEQSMLDSQRHYGGLAGIADFSVPNSARESAALFDAMAREAEETARAVAALRSQIDPLGVAQTRMNAEMAQYSDLASRGAISTTELATAQKLARERFEATEVAMRRLGGTSDNLYRRQQLLPQVFDIGTTLYGGMNPIMVMAQQGPQIAQIYAGQGGVNAALKDTAGLAASAARGLGLILPVAIAGAAAIAGMTYEIDKMSSLDITLADVAKASVEVLADAIYGVLKPAIDAVAPWFQSAWDLTIAGVKIAGNFIINSFRAAFNDIRFTWEQFPNILGAATIGAANASIAAMETLVQKGIVLINGMIAGVNKMLPESVQFRELSAPEAGRLPNPYKNKFADAWKQRNEELAEIMGSDPLGEYFDAVKVEAISNAQDRLAKSAKGAGNAYRDLVKDAQDRIDQMRLEMEMVGKTGVAADTARFQQDLLQRAMDKGRAIDAAKIAQLKELAGEYGRVATQLAEMRALEELDFERMQIGRSQTEQRVYSELRQIGLDINSAEGQRIANGIRINEQLLEQRDMASEIAGIFAGMFSGPLKDADEFFDKMLKGFAGIGERNLQKTMENLLGGGLTGDSSTFGAAANQNDPWAGLRSAVQTGAEKGTQKGGFQGILSGLSGLFGGGATATGGPASGLGSGLSAGVGGLGIGYQTQSPLMGALGGALSGLATGNPIGAIIGAAAGFLGGLFGQNQQRKQEREQNSANLRENMGSIEQLLATAEGRGVGTNISALREFLDQQQQMLTLAQKADDKPLADRIHMSQFKYMESLMDDWSRSFEGMVASLKSGQGLSSPFLTAAEKVRSLGSDLLGVVDDAESFNRKFIELGAWGLHWSQEQIAAEQARMDAQVRQTRDAAAEMALLLLTGAKEFSTLEKEIQSAKGASVALQQVLEDLGMSADLAAASIDAGMIKVMDRLRLTFETDLTRSINDLSGMGYLNEMVDAQAKFGQRVSDALAVGADPALAFAELQVSLSKIATGASLTDQQLQQLAGVFPALGSAISSLTGGNIEANLAAANAAVDKARTAALASYDKEISLYQDQVSEIERAISAQQQYIDSISAFRRELLTDVGLSPLSRRDRLAAAEREYNSVASAALGGDADAIGRVEDVSRTYLEEARGYYATSEGYYKIFGTVQSLLDQALGTATGQLDKSQSQLGVAQSQLSMMEAQRAELAGLNAATLSVSDAIAQLNSAQAMQAAAQAAYDALTVDRLGQLVQLMGAQAAGPDMSGFYRDVAAGYAYLGQNKVPGFAAGGDHAGGMRIVGERGPELEFTGPSRIVSNEQSRRMLDNSQIVAELRASRQDNADLREQVAALGKDVKRLISVIAAAGIQTTQAVQAGNEILSSVRSDMRRKG